jgi:hypothetical protein
MDSQPTFAAVQAAFSAALAAEDIPGARAETRAELQRVRDARTTWYGDEYRTAWAIDRYLRGEPPEL